VLDDAIVGDDNLDWVTPSSWERGRLDVSWLTSTEAWAAVRLPAKVLT
jgi:hypothetical protein